MSEHNGKALVDEGGYMTRDGILETDDTVYEDVPVPEWNRKNPNAKVRVRSLTGTDRDAFETSLLVGTGKNQRMSTLNIRAKLAALSIVDYLGEPLFALEDILALGKKNAAALDRVFEVAQRLSGISDADVEELAKNSGTAPSEALSSSSLKKSSDVSPTNSSPELVVASSPS